MTGLGPSVYLLLFGELFIMVGEVIRESLIVVFALIRNYENARAIVSNEWPVVFGLGACTGECQGRKVEKMSASCLLRSFVEQIQ